MFGGLNPKKMQGMMKQLGIAQKEVPAEEVIIKKKDGGETVIKNPSVTKINMQGQEMFQITGEIEEKSEEVGISEEDIKTIVEQTNVSEDEAKSALEETGDLAEAILKLSAQ